MDTRASSLDLGDLGLPVGSDRQIRETLSPVEAGEFRRSVNGRLVALVDPAFRKYRISLSGSDLHPPALAGIWPGRELSVVPVSVLTQRLAGATTINLERPTRADLVSVRTDTNAPVPVLSVVGRTVTLGAYTGAAWLRYRPVLECLVTSWSADEDEAAAASSWSLELEEV